MPWVPLFFGRHTGKTLPQVLFADPDWFFWAYDEGIFDKRGGRLSKEADQIHAKATSIRIEQSGTEKLQVEYNFMYGDHTSVGFNIVEASRPAHAGSTATSRADFIDMSVPRQQKHYDKMGGKLFLKSLKEYLFGDLVRMTRQRCDDFFDDETNFHRNT